MTASIYQAADNAIDASDRLVNLFMEGAYGFQGCKLARHVELLAEATVIKSQGNKKS